MLPFRNPLTRGRASYPPNGPWLPQKTANNDATSRILLSSLPLADHLSLIHEIGNPPLLIALSLIATDLDFKESVADPATPDASFEALVPGTRDRFLYQALDHHLSGRAEGFAKTMVD